MVREVSFKIEGKYHQSNVVIVVLKVGTVASDTFSGGNPAPRTGILYTAGYVVCTEMSERRITPSRARAAIRHSLGISIRTWVEALLTAPNLRSKRWSFMSK